MIRDATFYEKGGFHIIHSFYVWLQSALWWRLCSGLISQSESLCQNTELTGLGWAGMTKYNKMDFENISEESSSLYHVNPDLPSWVRIRNYQDLFEMHFNQLEIDGIWNYTDSTVGDQRPDKDVDCGSNHQNTYILKVSI